jgi:hypothetical protein
MSEHYNEADKPRLKKQLEVIRDVMLSANECGAWLTLAEIGAMTRYPEPSISAQLRNLRKKENGGYLVEKRLAGAKGSGLWKYRVSVQKIAMPVDVERSEGERDGDGEGVGRRGRKMPAQ